MASLVGIDHSTHAVPYPLHRAQAEGYFKPIHFQGIFEVDTAAADRSIARAAVDQLRQDLASGMDHRLLARCRTKARAEDVFRIYEEIAPDLSPIMVHSGESSLPAKIAALRGGTNKIVVTVNMLAEGFDMPQLKVAANFLDMIRPALTRSAPKPKIEIHRCCTEGSGRDSRVIDGAEWERRFSERWQTTLNSTGSQVEVFIWSDFHDRHLITDLLGIHLGNGFDTSNDVNKRVTWSRLVSKDRDEVQRLFDKRARPALLKHQFTLA